MESTLSNPAPPNLPGLTWRLMSREDLAALVELARACQAFDGGLLFLIDPDFLEEDYFPPGKNVAVGAFSPDERLVACSAVHLASDPGAQRAVIAGRVHPDHRNRGIGGYLMRWSQSQAHSFFARSRAGARVLQINTMSLTEPADRLYQAHGFARILEMLGMQRDLLRPLPDRPLPQDVILESWRSDLAEEFYRAYYPSFEDRPGFPGYSAKEWTARVTANDLVPDWTLLALSHGHPTGFVICNSDVATDPPSGEIWQVGVVPAYRRRGVGSTLMVEAMQRMKAAGALEAHLEVNVNNPAAIQAYEKLGFEVIGRRARYERVVEGIV